MSNPVQLDLVWDDAKQLLRHNWRLNLLLLGAFCFLPSLIAGWFGPSQEEQRLALQTLLERGLVPEVQAVMREQRLWSLPTMILSPIGATGLLIGWLTRRGLGEGDILRILGRVALPAVAVSILTSVATGFGLVFLILPGLYLLGRLYLALPALADGQGRVGVIDALRASWAATRGHTLRIIVIAVAALLLTAIIGGLLGGLVYAIINLAAGTVAADWVGAVVNAALTAVTLAIVTAISAGLWRQLARSG